MSIVGPWLVALLLGFLGSDVAVADLPASAEVEADILDVFDEPDPRSFTTGRLRRGDRFLVRDADSAGWLTIDPPANSLDWVEQTAIDEQGRVIAPRALVRSGHPSARMPGLPRGLLVAGTTVRLLDRPPLVTGQGRAARTWRAIAPSAGEVRYVRDQGVRFVAEPLSIRFAAEIRGAIDPGIARTSLPPEIAPDVAAIETDLRATLRQPVERWRLEPIRQRYLALLKQTTDPAASEAIRARLEHVAHQQEVARSARTIATILERSRRRDRALAVLRGRMDAAERTNIPPFEAQGLLQPSSRQVGGQRVFALIGPEGTTLAYLDIPAGLDAEPLLARQVGVRGTTHFSEALRARLIAVHDLEPLDDER